MQDKSQQKLDKLKNMLYNNHIILTNIDTEVLPVTERNARISEIYASQVFSEDVMRERLPKEVYKSLLKTMETGKEIDPGIADIVASAMKDWAIEHGATHFTHWFHAEPFSTW